ncbi:MAG: DUF3106 domain-containing protein [Deltaproteobacteria bacterium]|nr:DUF3106 domain-containing protein [Deltaproteobacteria bacterium]
MKRYVFRIIVLTLLFSLCASGPTNAGILDSIFSGLRLKWLKSEGKKGSADPGPARENNLLRWMRMSPAQQQMLRHRYNIFKSMPPQARRELERRHLFFRSLAPEQQEILKKKYKFYKNLDPIKRVQIRRLHTLWQKMPNSKQQYLILQVERIRKLPVRERERELSHSVIWQVFSPRERKSLGSFMNKIQIQIFPFLPDRDRGKKEIPEQRENQDLP